MKHKHKIAIATTAVVITSLMITAHHWQPQMSLKLPDIHLVSALIPSNRDNTPPPLVEHQISQTVPSQNDQISTQNQSAGNPMEKQNITPSDYIPPQPTEKEEATNTPTSTTQTVTKPTAPPASQYSEPKMGDTRIVNGQKQSYFLGFGWVDDMGENEVVYCEGMYENGNKIGIMDSDGDINKQVGIMD